MASSTDGDLAADAAAYLAKSPRAAKSLSGNTEEIERQSTQLVKWAKARGVLFPTDPTEGLERHGGTTAEHEVFYRQSDNRAVKRTHAGTFGITNEPKGRQGHATPLFYLRRLQLMNRLFASDVRLEGVVFGKSLIIGEPEPKPCAVISQPWCDAVNENDPHPSSEEIAEFMESLGFVQKEDAYFGWFNEEKGITVLDARPDNFIKTVQGVVPIDLVAC